MSYMLNLFRIYFALCLPLSSPLISIDASHFSLTPAHITFDGKQKKGSLNGSITNGGMATTRMAWRGKKHELKSNLSWKPSPKIILRASVYRLKRILFHIFSSHYGAAEGICLREEAATLQKERVKARRHNKCLQI